jgi:hypothetical protein
MTGEIFFWYVLPLLVVAVVWGAIVIYERIHSSNATGSEFNTQVTQDRR